MDDYPLIHYLEMGINVTLNTDDPAIERTDIAREYHLMEERYGLTPIQERALLMNAIDSAFTNEVMKEQLRILI